jgi:RNA polymerase sigma factor (sigma-70 family)
MTDDEQLLGKYMEERSEPAFGELVARHIDLVYATALRVVNGDTHLAQDVTQMVFIDLALKARRLPRPIVLAAWLHRHAWFTAATVVRTERRRKTREQTAMEMRAPEDSSDAPWAAIAPRLDEALNQLNHSDREALVLRFLKQQDLRTVGAAFGISEDSAQKRVSRALDKLRGVLSQRGVVLTAAALASVLAAQAATAAPAGLVVGVTAASLTATTPSTTTLTLLKFMAGTKLNTAIVSLILVAGVLTPLMVQHNAQARLRDQRETLRQQTDQLAGLQNENERLASLLSGTQTSRALPDGQFNEMLRLRGEVGQLQATLRELSGPKTNEPLSREEALASMRQLYVDRINRLKQRFADDPSQSVPELQYLTDSDWLKSVVYDHHRIDPDNRYALSSVRGTAQLKFMSETLSPALRAFAKNNNGQFPTDLSQLAPYFPSSVDGSVLQNWVILPSTSLPAGMRVEDEWIITQKAPVDATRDQRFVMGLKTMQLGRGGTNDWVRNE